MIKGKMLYFNEDTVSFQAEFSKVEKMPKKPKNDSPDRKGKKDHKKDYSKDRQRKRGEI